MGISIITEMIAGTLNAQVQIETEQLQWHFTVSIRMISKYMLFLGMEVKSKLQKDSVSTMKMITKVAKNQD